MEHQSNPVQSHDIGGGWSVTTANPPFALQTESRPGAVYHPLHVKRMVKIYPIQEHELHALQNLSAEKTLWSSVASGALALLLGCLWEWSQLPKGASLGKESTLLLVITSSVAVFGFMKAELNKREAKVRLKKLLEECTPN